MLSTGMIWAGDSTETPQKKKWEAPTSITFGSECPECSDDTDSTDSEWTSDGESSITQHQHAKHVYLLERLLDREGTWSGIDSGMADSRYNVDFNRLSPELQQQLNDIQPLTKSAAPRSTQVLLRGIPMTRKTIWNSSKDGLTRVRQEIAAGEKLHETQHIIKLVGTYVTYREELAHHVLTFPVAVCNLDEFLDDCEAMHLRRSMTSKMIAFNSTANPFSKPWIYNTYIEKQREDGASDRLVALELPVSEKSTRAQILENLQWRLKELMGCLTQAMSWMHARNVAHCDLKPSNILLQCGQVYISDFGHSTISSHNTPLCRDARNRSPYTAPELCLVTPVIPFKADVYSLGCIFLQILTVSAGASQPECTRAICTFTLKRSSNELEAEIKHYINDTLKLPKDSEINKRRTYTGKKGHHPFTVQMIVPLLSLEPKSRPEVRSVNERLWACGGLGRLYHGSCCKRTLRVQTLVKTADGECWE